MALIVQGESSNSSNFFYSNSTPTWKFHVFLSSSRLDIGWQFTNHLHADLLRKEIIAFRDRNGFEREVISQQILKAIEDSLFAIVILSQKYAHSVWCLDELKKILEARMELGREVFPIFYGVDPSDVRHQRGSFAEALAKHEERFKENKEKVQRWRDALTEVANLPGWESNGWHETDLIENIVEEIWTKLFHKLPSYDPSLVGIDSRMVKLNSYLRIGLDDVRFVGIWGMGGIGKTTLATFVYESISRQFEICCFLANVRETSVRFGHIHLQRMFLSHLNIKNMVVYDTYEGRNLIKNLFCSKKVLLVLDDVNHVSQLENLAKSREWFGAGSRIIITTRDKHLLKSHEVDGIYGIELMNHDESLQLFSQKAFKRGHPKKSYLELSKSVVQYAGGLPLALQVLGSFLYGRSVFEWENALDKLKRYPNHYIIEKLRISYDELEDSEKTIFLDIACFFKGWEKDKVIHIFKNCGLHPTIEIGLTVLLEKSLLTEKGNCLEMHDLLQVLGRSIVLDESPYDASKRTRLWSLHDIDEVLTKNKGTEAIQCMVLRLHEPHEARWHPKAFSKMCNLRLLIVSSDHQSRTINDMNLPYDLKCLSSALKVIQWWGFPLKLLPLETALDELVDLSLPCSKIKQLWNGTQRLKNLKFIDLSHSKYLVETPNFFGVPNLKRLILEGCTSLVKIHPSLGEHKKLELVNLRDCKTLKILPRKLEMSSLMELVLCGCSKVGKLPEFGKSMEVLFSIDLQDTTVTELPISLGFLTGLGYLNLNGCKNLVCLPNTFQNLKHLRILTISGCSEFSKLPENLNENEALEKLDVSGTCIKEVPLSIFQLRNLKTISFDGCKGSTSNSWSLSHVLWKIFGRHPVPMWLWRTMGLVLSVIGEVSYGLSSSFKHLCGEWNWWKMFVYSLLSFIVCGMMFVRRACRGWKSLLVKAHVAFVVLMASSLYSYVYDKFMTGKSDAFDLISSGAFALMSLSISRLTDPGFEAGVFNFLLGFLTQQLMKINFILVLVAAGVCYFFILLRCCLDSHFQPHAETEKVQVQCSLNSVDLENEGDVLENGSYDLENGSDDLENEGDDQENESEDLENEGDDLENEGDDLENEGGDRENEGGDQENESDDLENEADVLTNGSDDQENESADQENEVLLNPSRKIKRGCEVQQETETARVQEECSVNIVDLENEVSLNPTRNRKRDCQVQPETETAKAQDQCIVDIVARFCNLESSSFNVM